MAKFDVYFKSNGDGDLDILKHYLMYMHEFIKFSLTRAKASDVNTEYDHVEIETDDDSSYSKLMQREYGENCHMIVLDG